MIPLLLALVAATGIHLVWTSVALGWRGLGAGPRRSTLRRRPRLQDWLTQAGLDDVAPVEFAATSTIVALLAGGAAYVVFGGVPTAVVAAGLAAVGPAVGYRGRRRHRRERAQEAWPRLIEEVRILTGSVGRSVPQALFEAGSRAPAELAPAFEAGRREWLMTTDFARTAAVLKHRLADPTADAVLETLLVAHELGGGDLGARLEALAEDRLEDLHGRRDARAEQAGVRFARAFVLVVPFGMALAGLSIGDGRAAYETSTGQAAVLAALVMVAGCWVWSGRILRLPAERRLFAS